MFTNTRSSQLGFVVILSMLIGACAQPHKKATNCTSDSAPPAEPTATEPKEKQVRTCRFTGRVKSVKVFLPPPRTRFSGIGKYEDGTLIGCFPFDQRWMVKVKVESILDPAPFVEPDGVVYFWVHSPAMNLGIDMSNSTDKRFLFTIRFTEDSEGRLDLVDFVIAESEDQANEAES